jgi:hypothetical protein
VAQLVLAILFLSLPAQAVEFIPLGEVRWSPKKVIEKTKFGGISAVILKNEKLYLLSDDRGLVDEPRFYEFDVVKNKNLWNFTNEKVYLFSLPKKEKLKEVLDPESFVMVEGGFLIGSEGDNNKKPRVAPRVFQIDSKGKWLADIQLPEKLIPEATGQQKKGVANNFAFEAMTASPEFLWFTTERPLVQDVDLKDDKYRFRLFQFKKNTLTADQEFYFEGLKPQSRSGIPIVSGWTDMIYRNEKTFWLLERTLRLTSKKLLEFDCRLIEYDFSQASSVAAEDSLVKAKKLTAALVKNTYDLKFKDRALGNCEGFLVGPGTGEYKTTLWVVTDNNFSKMEDTALYFFGVKE